MSQFPQLKQFHKDLISNCTRISHMYFFLYRLHNTEKTGFLLLIDVKSHYGVIIKAGSFA